jgi:hypothetical protein
LAQYLWDSRGMSSSRPIKAFLKALHHKKGELDTINILQKELGNTDITEKILMLFFNKLFSFTERIKKVCQNIFVKG